MDVLFYMLWLSIVLWCIGDKSVVCGEVLEPIYWNNSNSQFKTPNLLVKVNIDDKLDIICPLQSDEHTDLYYKIYLVDLNGYEKCDTSGGRRLITCSNPEKEKKYTFFFQEISPSPWALEFRAGEDYYVISTSDGTEVGLNQMEGGSCIRHNMKLQIKVNRNNYDSDDEENTVDSDENNKNNESYPEVTHDEQKQQVSNDLNEANQNPTKDDAYTNDQASEGDKKHEIEDSSDESIKLMIGVIVGAGIVIVILLCLFFGYRLYASKKQKDAKKYSYHHPNPRMNMTSQNHHVTSQVTLMPINPIQSQRRQMSSFHGSRVSRIQGSNTFGGREQRVSQPPPYNDSFLGNGGSVVAV